jgi:hypothetical protein
MLSTLSLSLSSSVVSLQALLTSSVKKKKRQKADDEDGDGFDDDLMEGHDGCVELFDKLFEVINPKLVERLAILYEEHDSFASALHQPTEQSSYCKALMLARRGLKAKMTERTLTVATFVQIVYDSVFSSIGCSSNGGDSFAASQALYKICKAANATGSGVTSAKVLSTFAQLCPAVHRSDKLLRSLLDVWPHMAALEQFAAVATRFFIEVMSATASDASLASGSSSSVCDKVVMACAVFQRCDLYEIISSNFFSDDGSVPWVWNLTCSPD